MKKTDVKIGATYLVKVASNLVPVKITDALDGGGWEGTSVKTGKAIRIKSAQRLRKRLGEGAPVATKAAKATKNAKPARKRNTGEHGATGGKRDAKATKPTSLLDAAAHLLAQGSRNPMRCKDLVELAAAKELWTPGEGKTPANTLYASILREIKTKGAAARFIKVERGQFEFNARAKG
ncbi:MAG TPA: HTH domain-containing protein [Phycisphaerae bacterium]|nr:HTH domain-containing protein [Phycisphaerae bacterium]